MKKLLWLIGLVLIAFVSQAQTTTLFYSKSFTNTSSTTATFKEITQSHVLGLVDTIADLRADILSSGGISQATLNDTASALRTAIALKVNISDTASMLSPYALDADISNLAGLGLNNIFTGDNHFQVTGTGEKVTITEMSGSVNLPLYVTYTGGGKGLELGWRTIRFPTDGVSSITFQDAGTISAAKGLTLHKNNNDAITSAIINQQQGTGNILDLKFGGTLKASFDKDGILNAAGISTSTVSTTEFGYLDGVTSAIQTQLGNKVNISDTASMLSPYLLDADTASLSTRINLKVNISDTAAMLSTYAPEASPTFTGIITASSINASGELTVTGGIKTSSTSTNANFRALSGSSPAAVTESTLLIGGSSSTFTRVFERGSTNATLTANNSYASHIIGTITITETSGASTHALLSQLAIKPLSVTNDATATTTNAATLYIEGAMSGVTPTGGNYSLWIDDGESRFDGEINMPGLIGVATAMDSALVLNRSTGRLEVRKVPSGGTIDATPTNGSTNAVQSDGVFDALALKANLASPTFTGTPAAPTAAVGTNTTQLATTAFVMSNKATRLVLGADEVNNNAVANTLEDITALQFPVTAGNIYKFRIIIPYDADVNTTGSRWTINGPTATWVRYWSTYSIDATTPFIRFSGAYNLSASATASTGAAGAAYGIAIIEGMVAPSASGNITPRFASEVANSAITALAGAYVEYEQLD
jgi:hypothetical protein